MIPESIIQSDLDNIRELQPEGWPEIVPSFEYYLNNSFCRPVKIIVENKIAGIGSGNTFGKTAWLSHIITRPEFRNRGIAGLIVDYLHSALINSGTETISLIATEYGYPVYRKAGFVIQSEYIFLEKSEPMTDIKKSKNIIKFEDDYLSDVLSLDKIISGESRGCLLTGKLQSSYVYIEEKRITGYYLPELGEGMIAASNSEAGLELLKFRGLLRNSFTLPCANHEGINFLLKNGFKEIRRVKRMISGKNFLWHPDKIYNRIGGNFG